MCAIHEWTCENLSTEWTQRQLINYADGCEQIGHTLGLYEYMLRKKKNVDGLLLSSLFTWDHKMINL